MAASLTRMLKRFEQAVRDHEMMGARMPEEHDAIQRRYENTKAALEEVLNNRQATVRRSRMDGLEERIDRVERFLNLSGDE